MLNSLTRIVFFVSAEAFMSEVEGTLEDLEEQRNEKLNELAEIEAKPDPAKNVKEAIETKRKILEDIIKKIDGSKRRIATYQDLHALRAKMDGLSMGSINLPRDIAQRQILKLVKLF